MALCLWGRRSAGWIAGGEGHLEGFIQLPRFLGFDLHCCCPRENAAVFAAATHASPRKTGQLRSVLLGVSGGPVRTHRIALADTHLRGEVLGLNEAMSLVHGALSYAAWVAATVTTRFAGGSSTVRAKHHKQREQEQMAGHEARSLVRWARYKPLTDLHQCAELRAVRCRVWERRCAASLAGRVPAKTETALGCVWGAVS